MKFCKNCGNKIENEKFCSNCGAKTETFESNNKIDKSVSFLKENAKAINSEINESVVINELKKNTSNIISIIIKKIIDVLGIIGLITIIGQIIVYFGMNKIFLFQEAYLKYQNSSFEDYFSGFIAEIIPSTILPFLFMFLSGRKKQWLLVTSLILLFLLFVISAGGNAKSRNFRENETLNDTSAVSYIDTISTVYSNNQNTIPDDTTTSYSPEEKTDYNKESGDFQYLNNSYKYVIKYNKNNDTDQFTIYKNSTEIFSEDIGNDNAIRNIKFYNKYLYFESHGRGGSSGNHFLTYYVFDINKLHLNFLNYSCDDYSYEYCEFGNLEEVKKDTELYEFYMKTIPKHNPKDNYFDEE